MSKVKVFQPKVICIYYKIKERILERISRFMSQQIVFECKTLANFKDLSTYLQNTIIKLDPPK